MRKNIASFITYKEFQCRHCGKLPPLFYHDDGGRKSNVPTIYKEFFDIFKHIREEWGRAINITSGYRCPRYQRELYDQGISNAILSPHSTGFALDLDCKTMDEVDVMAKLIESICSELRIGVYKYKMTFIHIDAAYKVFPILSRHWQKGVRWYA